MHDVQCTPIAHHTLHINKAYENNFKVFELERDFGDSLLGRHNSVSVLPIRLCRFSIAELANNSGRLKI